MNASLMYQRKQERNHCKRTRGKSMEESIYRPTPRRKTISILSGSFLFSAGLLIILLDIFAGFRVLFVILFGSLAIYTLYLGITLLLLPFTSELRITEIELQCKELFTTTKYGWLEICQAQIDTHNFILFTKPHTGRFPPLFPFNRKDRILIHYFVDNWVDESMWEEQPLLRLLNEKLTFKDHQT